MTRFTVYSFLWLCSLTINAQVQLEGQVFSALDSSALAGVEIFNVQSENLAITNNQGFFKLKLTANSIQDLVFFSYQYQSTKVQLHLSQDSSLKFYLYPLGEELDEVIIQQKRAEAFRGSRLNEVEGTAVYAGKKSEVIVLENTVANLAANNARQVFAQVVGLNIYENNDAGLQLNIGGRGLDPNRSSNFNVRQNGYDISADVLGYPESYYTPTAEALDEIQVVRGAASLQYGTQFGGFLNFKMKGPAKDTSLAIVQRNTIGSFGLFTNFTSLSGRKGKWGFYTFFNYKEGQGWRPNSQFSS
ncbi:MAG: TonB-dependent receptor, partial [Bacteroidetes bacterium]